MDLQEFKKIALRDENFKAEYERYDLAFEIGQMIVEARILKGITQHQLASLIKTKQPSIARLENGKKLPSLSFLSKIAEALGTHLLAPRFAFFEVELSISPSAVYICNTDTQFLATTAFTSPYSKDFAFNKSVSITINN